MDFRNNVSYSSFLLTILICFLVSGVSAGEIDVGEWRGHKVVRLSGEIKTGLAKKLKEQIGEADVWSHEARILLLDSPGGSVDEALSISNIFDEFSVHTVVPNGASCASACASIVFVAGKFRTVEVFGRLGQHSCARNGVIDQHCNEEISEHAVQHGVSRGSIAAFVTFTPPSEIIWFSREDVDGWGLSRYPGEKTSGFEKSEPRVIKLFSGNMPPAQAAWRLDFQGDGYRAFARTVSDAEREMQLNLFCYEHFPGRLFLSMEINGNVKVLDESIKKVTVATEKFSWDTDRPIVLQWDPDVSAILMEIPKTLIREFLTSVERVIFRVNVKKPFDTIQAETFLSGSQENLIFAANHCSRGEYDLKGHLIQ